jgi:hypothetical protein
MQGSYHDGSYVLLSYSRLFVAYIRHSQSLNVSVSLKPFAGIDDVADSFLPVDAILFRVESLLLLTSLAGAEKKPAMSHSRFDVKAVI